MVTFKQALKYALKEEEKARDNYLLWSSQTDDKNAKQLFKNLSRMEKKHVDAITHLISKGGKGIELTNFELIDMSHKIIPHSTRGISYLEKIIKYAISLEDYSMRNYASMASKADELSIKELFISLSTEEKYHKTLLTQQYNRILKAF